MRLCTEYTDIVKKKLLFTVNFNNYVQNKREILFFWCFEQSVFLENSSLLILLDICDTNMVKVKVWLQIIVILLKKIIINY